MLQLSGFDRVHGLLQFVETGVGQKTLEHFCYLLARSEDQENQW